MIDLLIDYAKREGLTHEPGLERRLVRWLITCTDEGRYTGILSLGDGKGEMLICPKTPGMNAGGKSHFLADSVETITLYTAADEKKPKSAAAKQHFFLQLLGQAAQEIPVLAAGSKLLLDPAHREQIHRDLERLGANPTDMATLRIGQRTILKEMTWRGWWREERDGLAGGKKKPKTGSTICLITGDQVTPARTHPPIKHLTAVGGAKGGDVLVAFDKDAFESLGFRQSLNASMSEETAAAYAAALNHLLESRCVRLGNTLATWWFTGEENIPENDEVMAWFSEPPEQTAGAAERRAHSLLTAIRTGQRDDLAGSRFVALMLSGAAGRVMVREVMQGSFEDLAANTESWFRDLGIIASDGKSQATDPKFSTLAASLVRNDRKKSINEVLKEVPSPWLQQLWRAALTGSVIPSATLAQAVHRNRIDVITDQPVSHARMALIKAYLIRNKGDQDMHPHMNPDHPNPAYHCGRALALFARLQRAALGDVGAGVVQRYYTAAAQTPGLVLGRLAGNAKNHLAKLEGGLAWWYENQLAGIMCRIGDGVPRTLTLEEQSLFALGYYQQLAAINAGKQNESTQPE